MPRREKSTTQKTDGWNTKMNRVYIISIRVLRSRCGRDTKHSDSVVPNCDSCWRLVQFSNSPHIFCVFSLVFLFHFFFFFWSILPWSTHQSTSICPPSSLPQKAVVWKDDCLPSPRTTYPSNIAFLFSWPPDATTPWIFGRFTTEKANHLNRSAENKWK